jgi:WD40 repeat protein
VACSAANYSFTLMSTHRYEHEITITGPKETIAALEFSPDGRALASGCEDGSITIFSTISWEPSLTFVNVSPSTSLVWHPRIEGLLFCGFKSGDVLPLRTNCPGVSPKEAPSLSDLTKSFYRPTPAPGSGHIRATDPPTVSLTILH